MITGTVHMFRLAGIFLLCAFAASATDDDPSELLDRARRKIVENLNRSPRYTCVQSITRQSYIPRLNSRQTGGCGYLKHYSIDDPQATSRLAWRDTLRFDAGIVDGHEIYSWAGAKSFTAEDKYEIAGDGAMSTGDFGGFLTSIFGFDHATFTYKGRRMNGSEPIADFEYRVPVEKSKYELRVKSGEVAIGFQGEFWIDPRTADLKRLTVVSFDRPPGSEVCEIVNAMDYQEVKIGTALFLLPRETKLTLLDQFGDQSENETAYTACREYHGESTIHFEDYAGGEAAARKAAALGPFPPDLKLDIRLQTAIDSASMMAGDAVEGVLVKPVKAKDGSIILPKDARVHGRIVRMREYLMPARAFVIGLRFDFVDFDGVQSPLMLHAVTDPTGMTLQARRSLLSMGMRQSLPGVIAPRPDVGEFVFPSGKHLRVPPGFVSHWVTATLTATR